MMTVDQFRAENLVKDGTPFSVALDKNLPVAYTCIDKVWYYAVKENDPAFDPVWSLFGLGKLKRKSVIYTSRPLTLSETGVLGVPGRNMNLKTILTDPRSSALPKPDDTAVQVRIRVQTELSQAFPIPATAPPLVSDIRAVTASVKDAKGRYTSCGTHTVHRLYMATAFTILRKMGADKRDGVVALVVDKEGRIISWGRKNPAVPCWHGETSSIMRLGGNLPKGCCVFSTLKPCQMCSSLIYQASGGDVLVLWGENDPGSAAQDTALDRNSVGYALDGHKQPGLAPYPILMRVKGPPGAYGPRDTMANSLKNSFAQSGERSTIDHITTSPEAADLIMEAELALKNKIAKYQSGAGKNENVKRVVEYLVNFLKLLKLNPDDLGK